MDHNDIRHKLSEFIDSAVTPGEKADIEQHLKTCAECSEALRELRKTIGHIHAVEEVESPAWMTQKIMAKVREEQEAKKGLWQRVFAPFLGKFPVQAVAVLFLAVTAFYLYSSIDPAQKYAEEPAGVPAKKEPPAAGRMQKEDKTILEAAPGPKQTRRKPGYASLEMKYSYEKPAAPVPQEQPTASAPARALIRDETDREKRPAAPGDAAPSMMTEQAAPAAGAVRQTGAGREAISEERKATKALDADREAEALLDVTEHFVKIDLNEKMKTKGLRYHTRKFETGPADLGWMRETSAFRASPCSKRYVVDVDLSGKLSKYLYCYDQSRIRLLGIYEQRRDGWSEKRR